MAPEPQRLLDEAAIWSHNRRLYPGWLIAPDKVRERIWEFTRNWIPFYLEHRVSLKPVDDLRVLFELNWRLETSLLPIFSDVAQAMAHSLDSINPFPDSVTDLPGTPLSPNTPSTDSSLDWQLIRDWWTALGLGIARFYREERQSELFELWYNRLDKIGLLSADVRSRLCYERCLNALANMDDEEVQAAVTRWPTETQDIYWGIRRAGILAELGSLDEALSITNASLTRLKHNSSDSNSNIPVLSREGWALWLENGLKHSIIWRDDVPGQKLFHDEAADRQKLRDRFRQLRPFGSDPNDLSESLEVRLGHPITASNDGMSQRVGFELGRVISSFQGESGPSKERLAAYQYLRLSEESGIPPTAGSVNFTVSHLTSAGEQFREYDPVRTQSLMFRLMNEKVTDPYLSRHRIAALPKETVQSWRASAIRTVVAALPLCGRGIRENTEREKRARARLGTAIVLLGRVLVRDTPEHLVELWELAKKLCQEAVIRESLSLHGPFSSLLRNLLQTSPVSLLESVFRSLCELPIPGENGFLVSNPEYWPDPAELVGARLAACACKIDGRSWTDVISRHVALLKSNDVKVRRLAFWRVSLLSDLGLLSVADRREVARLFWLPAGIKLELPQEAWGSDVSQWALAWPTPSGANAAERVKKSLLARKLGAVDAGLVQPGEFFDLVLYSTRRVSTNNEPRREFIAWTAADLRILFEKILDWWKEHGKQQAEQSLKKQAHRWFDDRAAFRRLLSSTVCRLDRTELNR